jgi:ribonuclease-3
VSHPLAVKLGLSFRDETLLQTALIHRSRLNEQPQRLVGLTSNERLEFLGDAVMNMISAEWLYRHYPTLAEGDLTRMRISLVRTSTLAEFARRIDLGRYAYLSRGEQHVGRERPALLADLFEALLGAIYLDQGLVAAQTFLEPFLTPYLQVFSHSGQPRDARTELQELTQARYAVTPTYEAIAVRGPDHAREYEVEVRLNERTLGSGVGRSKRQAAQAAAAAALQQLNMTESA